MFRKGEPAVYIESLRARTFAIWYFYTVLRGPRGRNITSAHTHIYECGEALRTCPSFCAPARELRGVARRRRIGSWRSLASGNRLKHCRRHGGESEIHQCRMCKGSWSHMRSACVGIQCLSAPSSAAFVVCMPVLKLVRRMWFMRCMSRGHRCIMQCSNPYRTHSRFRRGACALEMLRAFSALPTF